MVPDLSARDSQSGTTTTNLIAVPVTSGSRLLPGSILGENFHTQVLGEVPAGIASGGNNFIAVAGTISFPGNVLYSTGAWGSNSFAPQAGSVAPVFVASIGSFSTISVPGGTLINNANPIAVTSTNTSGSPFNDVQRSVVVYWWLAL